jgi:hypothetical protein
MISLAFGNTPLSPGSGKLASIKFNVKAGTPDGKITIDSTKYNDTQSLEITPSNGIPFVPYFTGGYIRIGNPTDIKNDDYTFLPKEFALEQNYPNPFNPSTNIKFALPAECDVKLAIFNVLGQKVKTLIDRRLSAGSYNITFDGRGDNNIQLASGIYYYRITAGDFNRNRTMMLLK